MRSMPLVTRTLTNAGAPLYAPGGVLLANKRIRIDLIDSMGNLTDAWDALSGERVGGAAAVVVTDAAAEFSVDLWPNARGNRSTRYRCTVDHPGFRDIRGVIEEGPLPLQWVDFTAAGAILTPMETGLLAEYLARIEAAKVAAEAAASAAAAAGGVTPIEVGALALSGHSAVALDLDGRLVPASCLNFSHVNAVLGVVGGAHAAGDNALVQTSYALEHSGWSWTPSTPVLVGAAGQMVQSLPPGALFSQVIGQAISPTRVLIDVHPPLLL